MAKAKKVGKPAPAVVLSSADVVAPELPRIGRPSTFDETKAARVCELVAQGYSLRKIAELEPELPLPPTFLLWCHKTPALAELYSRARASAMQKMAEDIIEISDSTSAENVNVARLQVDTRKWLMSKLAPRQFGDRMVLAGDNDAPLVIAWAGDEQSEIVDITPES